MGIHIVTCSFIFDHSQNKSVHIHTVRYLRAPNRIKNGTVSLLLPISLDTKLLNSCKKIINYGIPFKSATLLGEMYGGCDARTHCQLIQDTGAQCAIMVADTYEVVAVYNSGNMKNITIPVLFTGLNQARAIVRVLTANQKLLKPTLITLVEDENIWQARTSGAPFIVFQVFILGSYGIIMVVLLRALFLFLRTKNFKKISLEPGEQILLINFAALIFSILSLIDPFNMRNITDRTYLYITLLLTFPLVILGMLRLSFFFAEILVKRKLLSANFNYFRYPFILISLGSFVLYFAFAILFVDNKVISKLLLAANLTNIIFLFFAINLYVISGFLMIKAVRAGKSEFMKKVIPILSVVTFGAILYFIANLIFLVNYQARLYSSYLFEITFIIFWLSIVFIIGGQVFFFREPKSGHSRKTGTKNSRNNEMKKSGNSKKFEENKNENENNTKSTNGDSVSQN
eukprot:TRINITY_DN6813_c0_g1_i1.p1 TRINITY_DN6813_c0_g1~~TRINITY_DN6813_c0_g1_i1.p1  ORF type:complete len:475 (+),score=48.55 TRINITY_DN6813_c0_g1_i1:54-1427(+)